MFYMQPTFEVLFTNKSYIPVKNVSIRYIVSIHVCSFHCSLVKTEATNQLSFLFSCSRQMIRWALLLSCSMTSRTESSSHGNARVRKSSYRMLEMWTTSCSGNERKRTDREQQKKDLKLGVELLKENSKWERKSLSLVFVIHRFKTKLAASLARCRIKHDLLSIECILPESVKMKQERSSCLPLYAWVNTLKSRSAEHTRTGTTHSPTRKQIMYTCPCLPVYNLRNAL